MLSESNLESYREVDKRSLVVAFLLLPFILIIALLPWILFPKEPPIWLLGFCLIWCSILALFPYHALRKYVISKKQNSWILKWSESGIWCRFKKQGGWFDHNISHNIAKIPAGNIDWIRILDHSRVSASEVSVHYTKKHSKFLEIGLNKLDLSTLREALKTEAIRRNNQLGFHETPLMLSDEGTLLISLQNPNNVITNLQKHFRVLEAKVTKRKNLAEMSNEEKLGHIKGLIQKGDKVAAVRATSEGFKCTLTEANRFVDELGAGKANISYPAGSLK
ncbi:hypothetical protein GUA87_14175 [Sneathiella sp. P13V-1]|uniref:hypothetical protein n=1 Tax=Sneathiella sp. P13V-1 TaxID=2697366 RepID=UPI00187BB39E|nr:hypothetical protein [Sneathiella sp. P13V-1]MBE7638000.1 hypothetical protein [Sneathiella sp. P13V-1]